MASAGASQESCVIKLGYKASAEQFAPGKLLGFSCLAEEVGFDSVFISDHFQPWKHVDGHAPFSLTWLGALGARTSRVAMGTSGRTPIGTRDVLAPSAPSQVRSEEHTSELQSQST